MEWWKEEAEGFSLPKSLRLLDFYQLSLLSFHAPSSCLSAVS